MIKAIFILGFLYMAEEMKELNSHIVAALSFTSKLLLLINPLNHKLYSVLFFPNAEIIIFKRIKVHSKGQSHQDKKSDERVSTGDWVAK